MLEEGQKQGGIRMEFVFELLFEIIIEGTFDLGTSKKVPMAFRILALILFLALYMGIVGLLLIYGVDALRTNDSFGGCLCILVGLGIVFGFIFMIINRFLKVGVKE